MSNKYLSLVAAAGLALTAGCDFKKTESVDERQNRRISDLKNAVAQLETQQDKGLRRYGDKWRQDTFNPISIRVGTNTVDYFTGILMEEVGDKFKITHYVLMPGQKAYDAGYRETIVPRDVFECAQKAPIDCTRASLEGLANRN